MRFRVSRWSLARVLRYSIRLMAPRGDGRTRLPSFAGSTGLVGRTVCDVVDHPGIAGRAVVRSRSIIAHPKYEERVGELRGSRLRWPMVEAQDAFCALGTTIRKAGSRTRSTTSIMISSRNFAYGGARGGHRRSACFLRSEQIRIAVIFIWRPRRYGTCGKGAAFPAA